MAAMTTTLTEFANNGNSITYTTAGHTAVKPKLVLQKRRVPTGNQVTVEDTISVVHATEDDDGAILPQKVVFDVVVRRPINGQTVDVTAARDIIIDIVSGDEFANVVSTQEPLA